MEKLSLSVMEPGRGRAANGHVTGMAKVKGDEEEDVDAEGAQKSVNYLGMGDDDVYSGMPKKDKVSLVLFWDP